MTNYIGTIFTKATLEPTSNYLNIDGVLALAHMARGITYRLWATCPTTIVQETSSSSLPLIMDLVHYFVNAQHYIWGSSTRLFEQMHSSCFFSSQLMSA